jgi:hypothetical protein
MERLLKDGGDLDSMDRSLLDCEFNNEKSLNPCSRVDKHSLDPGKLSIKSDSVSQINYSSETLVSKSANSPAKTSRTVLPMASSNKSDLTDTERTPLFSGKKDTIVKFNATSSTLVLTAKDNPVQLDVSELKASIPALLQNGGMFLIITCVSDHFLVLYFLVCLAVKAVKAGEQ